MNLYLLRQMPSHGYLSHNIAKTAAALGGISPKGRREVQVGNRALWDRLREAIRAHSICAEEGQASLRAALTFISFTQR